VELPELEVQCVILNFQSFNGYFQRNNFPNDSGEVVFLKHDNFVLHVQMSSPNKPQPWRSSRVAALKQSSQEQLRSPSKPSVDDQGKSAWNPPHWRKHGRSRAQEYKEGKTTIRELRTKVPLKVCTSCALHKADKEDGD
jgi:hypothetical protein